MKILCFSPRSCWPLTTGARLRDYHLAHQLARHASVTFLGTYPAGSTPDPDPPPESGFQRTILIENDRTYTLPKLVRGFTGPHPVTVLNYTSPRVEQRLTDLLRQEQFDSVQLEGVHLVRYLPAIRASSPATAVISDWHNIESEILRRYAENAHNPARAWFARRTARLLESSEQVLLAGCEAHTVTSDRERAILSGSGRPVHTIPNGVDLDFYGGMALAPASPPVLLFVGSMDYHANIDAIDWFVREAWPGIRAAHPDLRLQVVGRNPPPSIQALAGNGIEITGTVEDVRGYYAQASAVVVPLRVGGGTRLKILEAMAIGVPVISTRLGAEGLQVADQRDILLADSAAEIAAAVSRLFANSGLHQTLVAGGRDLVQHSYGWPRLGEALFQIHREAVEQRRARP